MEGQWQVFEDHADFACVVFLDLVDGFCAAVTEGTLEVGELDDGHFCVFGSPAWSVSKRDFHSRCCFFHNESFGSGCWSISTQLLIDKRFEAAVRLCTNEFTSVDEECGGSTCAFATSKCHVFVDIGLVSTVVERSFEFRDVESELFGPLDEVGFVQVTVVREQFVVVWPEFTLRVRCHRCLRCEVRLLVEAQRQVSEDHADFACVVFLDLVDTLCATVAEGTLEVGELDDGHFCVFGSPTWLFACEVKLRT